MKEPQILPSPLKIAAEVDAALAAAGLTGPQVEREAIPLYLSFIAEMVDSEGKLSLNFHHCSPQEIAKHLLRWIQDDSINEQYALSCITEHLEETLVLTRAHGTLSDMKRQKLLNLNQQITDSVARLLSQASISKNKGL